MFKTEKERKQSIETLVRDLITFPLAITAVILLHAHWHTPFMEFFFVMLCFMFLFLGMIVDKNMDETSNIER